MHALVLGAGVVGVTTAYFLSQAGIRVTVIDRATDVADGASHANAGQLSYSFTDSLAKPSLLSSLPRALMGRDPALKVRIDPALIGWGLRFLRQCTSRRATSNTLQLLETSLRSAELMGALLDEVPIEFSHRPAGKLVLLPDDDAIAYARNMTRRKNDLGCDAKILSSDEALAIEPALIEMRDRFAGAVYSRSDDVGDARRFTIGLRHYLEQNGDVTFRMGENVSKLARRNGAVSGVELEAGTAEADVTIVCLGAWSRRLLQDVGVNAPIYPVRGYSLTLEPGSAAPNVSITSLRHRIVFSRINGDMRVAGFADFSSFDTCADADRTRRLLELAERVAPNAARYDAADTASWGGFRPMTPDGQPIVGATPVEGLYMNTGHGMLGWTLACASGHDVARTVARLN